MSTPNRDKFAALAQRQQQQQQQQQQQEEGNDETGAGVGGGSAPSTSVTAVKRDKFAALAARGAAASAAGVQVPLSSGSAPKRDKFAALAASQNSSNKNISPADVKDAEAAPSLAPVPAPRAATPPRRDKFAALAGRTSASSTTPPHIHHPGSATTTGTAPTESLHAPSLSAAPGAAAPARRDKLAAMSSSAPSTTAAAAAAAAPQDASAEERPAATQVDLETRRGQRRGVWDDVEAAEHAVTEVLDVARQTCEELAAATTTTTSRSTDKVRELAGRYTGLVRTIHAKLRPHAPLVRAYQAPTSLSAVYVAKVQVRLAEERRDLLRQHVDALRRQLDLRNSQGSSAGTVDDAAAAAAGTGTGSSSANASVDIHVGEKRKRDATSTG